MEPAFLNPPSPARGVLSGLFILCDEFMTMIPKVQHTGFNGFVV
jgi:hypothetical protein